MTSSRQLLLIGWPDCMLAHGAKPSNHPSGAAGRGRDILLINAALGHQSHQQLASRGGTPEMIDLPPLIFPSRRPMIHPKMIWSAAP
jgi:hypothetical protein